MGTPKRRASLSLSPYQKSSANLWKGRRTGCAASMFAFGAGAARPAIVKPVIPSASPLLRATRPPAFASNCAAMLLPQTCLGHRSRHSECASSVCPRSLSSILRSGWSQGSAGWLGRVLRPRGKSSSIPRDAGSCLDGDVVRTACRELRDLYQCRARSPGGGCAGRRIPFRRQ